ncbi:MAG: GNAT family N-acetyltransferase [Pseudomonadota bacterium]|nr:GNAT family N-acetyltransferase [Pseudomonadota bacterium]
MSSRPDESGFFVRLASWDRDRDALSGVRIRVFVEEQGVPESLEWDREDARAVHLLAVDAVSRPIGTARLLDTGQIGRMAVLPDWRNRGVGRALLRGILEIAQQRAVPQPFLNAQTSALPFYRRMGFVPVGEEFEEAGIPHRKMILGDRT